MKQRLIDFYLDWVNNYLTIERMSEDYGISILDCEYLINLGKDYHEQNVKNLRETAKQ